MDSAIDVGLRDNNRCSVFLYYLHRARPAATDGWIPGMRHNCGFGADSQGRSPDTEFAKTASSRAAPDWLPQLTH